MEENMKKCDEKMQENAKEKGRTLKDKGKIEV
jgi:hypothetical protein